MEYTTEPPIKPIEPTVLDQEGHVLYDPGTDSSREKREEHSSFRSGFQTAWTSEKVLVKKSFGFLPKLFFGVVFTGLLFIGLAAAGVFLGIFLVGLIAKMTFGTKPIRMKR